MSKFVIFYIVWMVTRSPLLAIAAVIAAYYYFDKRYLGLFPRITGMFRDSRELGELMKEVRINPHNAASHNDIGRILVKRKQFNEGNEHLKLAIERMDESAEANYYYGVSLVETGERDEGVKHIMRSLEINPRFGYGEPYLYLARKYAETGENEKSLEMLKRLKQVHTSNVEGFVLEGEVLSRMGKKDEAVKSFQNAIDFYRTSPAYKKREQRKWRIIAGINLKRL